MAVKSVLILTAGFGEGHNAAARNLREALATVAPEARVEVHDIFADAYGWVNRLGVKGYLWVINRLPSVWELVFDWLHRTSAVREKIGVFGAAARRLRAVIERLRPDVVVTTYPGYVHMLDHLRAEGVEGACGYVTLVTDSLTVNAVWYSGKSAAYVVANEATADVMARAGVPREMLHVLGFPTPPIFATMQSPKRPPATGERWRVLFMVNSGKRIALDAVRALSTLDNVELTVTVGRDDALERRIRTEVDGRGVNVFGWTSELPRLVAESHLVVSKAGGATVQECLSARTPMVVSQVVPGQEEGNARLLVASGAGVFADTAADIAAAVRRMTENPSEWTGRYEATMRLGRPDAARQIAEWMLGKFSHAAATRKERVGKA